MFSCEPGRLLFILHGCLIISARVSSTWLHHIHMIKSLKPVTSVIVAALLPKYGIGAQGKLPWRLKQEMKYFKDVTSAARAGSINAVVMGRKTWESIPKKFRPLPNRLNIVLSRSFSNEEKDGVLYFNSIDSIMSNLAQSNYWYHDKPIDKIFIIGGAEIYNSVMKGDLVDNLLVTNIRYVGNPEAEPVLDTFLDWDMSLWEQSNVSRIREFLDVEFEEGIIKEGDYEYEYTMWERRK